MAVGPDGRRLEEPLESGAGGTAAELLDFVRGLEGIIDRALQAHPRGDTFVYGIYQEMDPAVAELLTRRYLGAGWSEARLKPTLTGAATLILVPGDRPHPP